jgi:hypothetical protein
MILTAKTPNINPEINLIMKTNEKLAPLRSAFFHNSAATGATGTARRVHRAPAILDDNAAAKRRRLLHTQFVNMADDNLFAGAVANLPEPLQNKLSLSPSDPPAKIRNNLAAGISSLGSTEIEDIWHSIVKYSASRTESGNVGLATDTAKAIFPELAKTCDMA